MEPDDLQRAWREHDRRLQRWLAVDEQWQRHVRHRRVARWLAPFAGARLLEAAAAAAGAAAAAPVVWAHRQEPTWVWLGGLSLLSLLALAAAALRQAATAWRLDAAAPVAAARRDLERLQLLHCRTAIAALRVGAVVWLPLLLLWFEATTGIAALGAVPLPWLAANVLFGAALLLASGRWARRFDASPPQSPAVQWWLGVLSGRALQRAAAELAAAEGFLGEAAPH